MVSCYRTLSPFGQGDFTPRPQAHGAMVIECEFLLPLLRAEVPLRSCLTSPPSLGKDVPVALLTCREVGALGSLGELRCQEETPAQIAGPVRVVVPKASSLRRARREYLGHTNSAHVVVAIVYPLYEVVKRLFQTTPVAGLFTTNHETIIPATHPSVELSVAGTPVPRSMHHTCAEGGSSILSLGPSVSRTKMLGEESKLHAFYDN